jgi:hypothetical protein
VAAALALTLVQQTHLQVRLPRLLAQVVVAHQTVEVQM